MFCGIDFGTTNSTVGVFRDGVPVMVPLEDKNVTIPTALFFPAKSDDILFGRAAVHRYVSGEEGRFMRSIKRILGTDLMDKFTVINGAAVSFDDIISAFLKHLKQRAEAFSEETITSVVIGRPVHFQDDDENADRTAEAKLKHLAEKCGFERVAFQYEPIAAAFAHEQKLVADKTVCVVDLGGGTSDFTIMRVGPSYRHHRDRKGDILATSGVRIGGNDFDRALNLLSFMPMFGRGTTYGEKDLIVPSYLYGDLSEWSKINFTYTQKNIRMVRDIVRQAREPEKIERLLSLMEYQGAHRLLKQAEDAKINLTEIERVTAFFDNLDENLSFLCTRTGFETVIQPAVDRIVTSLRACLFQANLSEQDIDLVVLTGGSCEIPLIQHTIKKLFPRAHLSDTAKMESVGIGMTVTAARLFRD